MYVSSIKSKFQGIPDNIRRLFPGFLVCLVVAVTGQFLSEHYGAPAMLMALLIGIAFHFLTEEGPCKEGIEFTAKSVLRIGVALLGARISVDLIIKLGPELILLVIFGVCATILFGLLCAKLLGRGWRFALLTGGAVAICGASAAMAIAAILPKNKYSERNLIFTVLAVTILSTIAMVLYPIIVETLQLESRAAGVFLGGTIHDVAQVVGAGFTLSNETGETATLIKLIRVTMLAPVVLIFVLVISHLGYEDKNSKAATPFIPLFVLAFLGFATLNSIGLLPKQIIPLLENISGWALIISIAAVGMKTSLKKIFEVGGDAIIIIIAETLFIGGIILAGIYLLGSM